MALGFLWNMSILSRRIDLDVERMRLTREFSDVQKSYGVIADDGYISTHEVALVKTKHMPAVFGLAQEAYNQAIMVANQKTGKVYGFRAATGYSMEQIAQTMGATYAQCVKEAMAEYAEKHIKKIAAEHEKKIQRKLALIQEELKILENQEKLADKTSQDSHQRMGKVMA